jgi:putative hemolysin
MSRSLSGLSNLSSASSAYDDMMYTKTGELRKPCNPETEYRNPVTKRCVKIGGATDMQLRQGAAGPSDLSRGLSGMSSSAAASSAYDDMMYTKSGELRKPCNPDTEYRNPVTKRCVKIGGPTDMQKRLFSGEPLSVSRSGSDLSALSSRSGLSRSSGRSEDLLADSLDDAYEPPRVPGLREPLMSGYRRIEDDIFSFGRKSRRTCFGSCESCRVK